MAIFEDKTAVLAAIESVSGTAETLDDNTDNVRVFDVELTHIDVESRELASYNAGGGLGAKQKIANRRSSKLSFSAYVAGVQDGTQDQTPPIDAILRACGMAKTVVAGSPTEPREVNYKPVSDPAISESATMAVWIDGIRYLMSGCRGTVTFTAEEGNYMVARFEIQGIHNDKATVAFPTAGLDRFKLPPVMEPGVVVSAGLVDSTTASLKQYTLDIGNGVLYAAYVAAPRNQVLINERNTRLNVVRLMPATGQDQDIVLNNTISNHTLTIGAAGRQIIFTVPRLQVDTNEVSLEDRLRYETLDCRCLPNATAADGDYLIRFVGNTTS